MRGRLDALKLFHEGKHILRQDEEADLYRALEPDEARELAAIALAMPGPGDRDRNGEILRCLACLRPGSLDGVHGALLDRGILYPPVLWHGAGAEIAARVVGMLSAAGPDLLMLNRLLLALAWIGDDVARDAFRRWRDESPAWAAALHVPPHRYADEAGWELTPEGARRDLFTQRCHPLVVAGEGAADTGVVRVVADHEEACRWCGRAMTTLIDLDLASPALSFLGLDGRRLRIAACDACSCYGTMFAAVDLDGASSWHEANRRPDHLPADVSRWPRMPSGRLALAEEPRPWLEAASWLVPGVRFSQVGGLPTWVQGAAYPRCPDCERTMTFVAQVSNEDLDEHSEGIYYTFACPGCGSAAATYQQS